MIHTFLFASQGMVVGGPWPDVVSYNTLIAAAAGGGNVRVAMRIFSDMVDAGGRAGWPVALSLLLAGSVAEYGCTSGNPRLLAPS